MNSPEATVTTSGVQGTRWGSAARSLAYLIGVFITLRSLLQILVLLYGSNPFLFDEAQSATSDGFPSLLHSLLRAQVPQLAYLFPLPLWVRVLGSIAALSSALTAVLAAILLAKVLRAVDTKQSMVASTTSELSRLAGVLMIGGLLQAALGMAALGVSYQLDSLAAVPQGQSDIDFNLLYWSVVSIALGLVAQTLASSLRRSALAQRGGPSPR